MNKYLEALRHPLKTAVSVTKYKFPQRMWKRYNLLAQQSGLKNLYFVLSFDCDTMEDAEVVLNVDTKLRALGVNPVYAVPGELLAKTPDTYKELAVRGSEFMNHGHTEHTFWNMKNNRHESCFFYDQIPLEDVRQDILQGHESVTRIIGTAPTGYRAPHFGCFQSNSQLCFMHETLKELGYAYSSSTVPKHAFEKGPLFHFGPCAEFPVSGWWRNPTSIQDSWGYMGAPHATLGPEGYLAHAKETATQFSKRDYAGILNYYADPSHVHDKPEFFEAVKKWVEVTKPASYTDILQDITR